MKALLKVLPLIYMLNKYNPYSTHMFIISDDYLLMEQTKL